MMTRLVLLATACIACTPTASERSDDTDEVTADVTWHREIRPLLDQHCTRCHQPDQVGQDFTVLDTTRLFAGAMLAKMDAGQMPPPAADPECREYVGSDHMVLPAEGRDLFARWIELELPEGDPATAPDDSGPPSTELEDADLLLTLPTAYTPAFDDPRNPGNEYRCFFLEHGQDEDFFITAQQAIIDQSALLHHAVVLRAERADLPDDYDPAVGVDCINDTMISFNNMLGGWAPGMTPVVYDDGHGVRVGKDQFIVLQFHYYYPGPQVDGVADQSGYAFRTAPAVDTEMLMLPLGIYNFNIPAGDPAYSATQQLELPVPFDVNVHGVFPHMHQLGSGYRAWLDRDGEEQCIVASEQWSFDNQLYYQFIEPLVLSPGDQLGVECTWNNSTSNPDRPLEEPVDTRYGERTDEEMCFMFTLISLPQ